MFLREKLDMKLELEEKIEELESILNRHLLSDVDSIDKMVKKLLNYIDDLQNLKLTINSANIQTNINIGESKISISTAVEVRKSVKKKINLLNTLIEVQNNLDIFELMNQRDSFMKEFNSIDRLIRLTDWSVKLD